MSDNMVQLPVIETVKTAWAKVSGAKASIWAILIIVILLQGVIGYLNSKIKSGELGFFAILITIVATIFQLLFSWGLMYMGIQRAQDLPIQYGMVRYVFNLMLFFKMLGVYILQGLIVGLPAVILYFLTVAVGGYDGSFAKILQTLVYLADIVVGVFLVFIGIRMFLSKGIVIMQQIGPWTAIKMSFAATRGNVWRLIGLWWLNILIVIVSAIPFFLGLIWTLPFALINYGVVYRKLIVDVKSRNIAS